VQSEQLGDAAGHGRADDRPFRVRVLGHTT
jgi:hypothetical protein